MRKIFSLLFIICGVMLLFLPQSIEKEKFTDEQEKLIKAFETVGETPNDTVNESDKTEKPLELNGARAVLSIPKIELQIMVFNGAHKDALTRGVGMIEPGKEFDKNNVGLAGHRSTTRGKQFNRLDELKIGDEMEIKTENKSYHYQVVKKFVVHQSQIDVLKDKNHPLLTLVTCTPLGKKNPSERLIVQAQLID